MSVYLISYDLSGPTKNYRALYKALDKIDAKPVLESLWAVHLNNTTETRLGNLLLSYLPGPDDALLVVRLEDDTRFADFNPLTKLDAL